MLPLIVLSNRLMVSIVQHADAGARQCDDLVADEMDVELVGAVRLEVLRQLPAVLDSFAGALSGRSTTATCCGNLRAAIATSSPRTAARTSASSSASPRRCPWPRP